MIHARDQSQSYSYDGKFLDYAANTSRHAAETVVGKLAAAFPIASVLDVGCARGTWLKVWQQHGATDVFGIDGLYVRRDELLVDPSCFAFADLSVGFDVGRTFDLVQCLEVAEHLPSAGNTAFVRALVRHSRGLILFSAAPPGQGGEHHINEQTYEFWRQQFRAFGFHAVDFVRPQILADRETSFWYRYTIVLYVSDAARTRLPEAVRPYVVPDAEPIRDLSPLAFRVRKWLVAAAPYPIVQWAARMKAQWYSRRCT